MAAKLFEDFSGNEATKEEILDIEFPTVAARIGKVCFIGYEAEREGVLEHYVHEFKKSSRPFFGSSHDGSQLVIVGGKFRFTERGIVDN
jgi:hypothetical protein